MLVKGRQVWREPRTISIPCYCNGERLACRGGIFMPLTLSLIIIHSGLSVIMVASTVMLSVKNPILFLQKKGLQNDTLFTFHFYWAQNNLKHIQNKQQMSLQSNKFIQLQS